jgi:glycosyltransferase involved in cell wall biosynthesis
MTDGTVATPRGTLPRVMHVAPGYWAGDPRLYHLECATLLRAGYTVELVAHARPDERLDPRICLRSLGNYQESTLAWRLSQRMQRDRMAYALARSSKAALYHIHSLEFALWGGWLRRATGCPVIFDCREDFEGYARQRRGVPAFLRPVLARLVRAQLRLAARGCDALIVADVGTGEMLRSHARRLLVLRNFPRLDLFPAPEATDAHAGERSPAFYDIVYHGSIPRYHLEACLAIDAALVKRGYQVRWRLISKAIPESAWFTQTLAARGIQERFRLDGLIPHDQIAQEVVSAKVGLIPLPDLPKFRNNIPRKLFEFMALGMPVVLSDLPPSRPFVGDGVCALLVPPGDYDAYAEAIIRLLDDPELRCKMGAGIAQAA